jgi:predicted glycoside hydrolase/deacetylase ChbG (UPF0249 family)
MDAPRSLVVVADDFGIGPATSHGILDLAAQGKVTGTVLLVNSPHAEEAVRQWRQWCGAARLDLGWHACLTLDRPVLPRRRVASLVREDGSFLPLVRFIGRLLTGRIRMDEVRDELRAQYRRFVEMVGGPPALVNGHHHIQVLPRVGGALLDVLREHPSRPYVRRIREPLALLGAIPTARWKRGILATLGRRFAQRQERWGFPGNDYLAGMTDPRGLARRRPGEEHNLLVRWLASVPGKVVELVCHPGYPDESLAGRDEMPLVAGAWAAARERERALLEQTDLGQVCGSVGLRLTSPSRLSDRRKQGKTLAA